MLYKYDILRDCRLLEQEKTFPNLYKLICAHGYVQAAMWLEGDDVKSVSFNDLAQQCDNWAARLGQEFGKSGRVCICLDSCKEWFPLFWGLVRSGHDILTVDASATDEKLVDLMDQCGCRMLVSGKERNLGAGYLTRTVSDFCSSPEIKGYEPVWGHDIALCTSGTTADNRIFVYNEETICYLALFSAKVHDENRLLIDDANFRTLAFLPFHHVLGFAAIFIWSHFLGDTTVYLKDRSPQTIVKTVKLCRVSQIVTVPLLANNLIKGLKSNIRKRNWFKKAMFNGMVATSLSIQKIAPRLGLKLAGYMFSGVRSQLLGNDIKSLVLGGAHTDSESLRLLNALGYYTICGYGMTETAITGFETSYRLGNRLLGSIGTPMAYTEYRIKEGGNFGELQVRGKGLHDGRFVNGELLPAETDGDGWFSTGDIMRMNRSAGQYFIEGRVKDVIINESGENVYPDELEDLFGNLRGVSQFTVLGVGRKKEKYEDITLALNIGENMQDEEYIDALEARICFINKRLPVFKRLTRAIISADKFPTTSTMKVKRLTLKKELENSEIAFRELNLKRKVGAEARKEQQEESSHKPGDDRKEEIRAKVMELYAEVLNIPVKNIAPDANFIEELGGDSLQVMSFATKAEEAFGILIPAEAYIGCTTVEGACNVLYNLIYGPNDGNKLEERKAITDFEDTPEYDSFRKRLESLMADGAENPYFIVHDSPLRDTSVIDGKVYLDFGNYNYVGMSGRKEVNDAAKAAIDKYGTSASGSRLLAGEKPVHGELEREIAEWKHAESALVLVGGHSTNVTVVGNFCGKNDLILYDALAHNSIEQGSKLSDAVSKPFPHNNIEALEQILKAQRKYFEKVLIVIEGVYSMDGDISDVPAFVEIKKKYGCFLMVDEAHSACVLGPTGGGVDEYFGLAPDDIDIKYGTLSKGLGTCGGYVAGKRSLIEYLRYNLPGFVFSVGISPALAAGSLEAIRLLRHNPSIMESLHGNIKFFADEAARLNLNICGGGKSAILPVLVGRDEDAVVLSNEMTRRGILVPPAVYPAVPKNGARLRFDVNSEHRKEQITFALETLVKASRELGIELPGSNRTQA